MCLLLTNSHIAITNRQSMNCVSEVQIVRSMRSYIFYYHSLPSQMYIFNALHKTNTNVIDVYIFILTAETTFYFSSLPVFQLRTCNNKNS